MRFVLQRCGNWLRRTAQQFAVVAMAVGAVVGVHPSAMAAEQTFRVAFPKLAADWSPFRGAGGPALMQSFIWASPMYLDVDSNVHPYVFTSWTPNDDKSVWTFAIDPNAVFSDKSPITAADVKGSWEVASMPATKHQRIGSVLGNVQGFKEVSTGTGKDISGLVVKDDHTLEVHLTGPDPIFFLKISSQLVPIAKASQVRDPSTGDEVQEWWRPENGVIVSGPFIPTSMDLDSGEAVFEPNPNFFGPKPKLTRIEARSVEDPVALTAMLQNHQVHATFEFYTPTMVDDLGLDFIGTKPLANGHHFWLNVSRKPTDELAVRKALIMAVDRNGLIEASYPKGPYVKADQILNAVPGSDQPGVDYPYDPEAARKELASSSYGGPERLPKIMMVGISNPAAELAAQYIAEQWRQNLGITDVEMKAQYNAYSGPDQESIQVFRDNTGSRVPDAVAYLMGAIYSTSNIAKEKLGGYNNAEIDKLLDDAGSRSRDDPQRVALALQAQQLFFKDWPFIPWIHDVSKRFAVPEVLNYEKNSDWEVYEPWKVEIADK